ncbi:MAG: alcohol dehydrogenase AdhP [Endomicrobia bacterium]|nr:alcohol dehydrogenase AdhP [Endomicrobiia bacterium]
MDIPQKMKAAIAREYKKPLILEEIAVPEVKDHEILIKVMASGVCHTDLHAIDGDWPVKAKLPLIPGHEAVGKIVKKGAEVKHFNIGDIVGVPWLYSACGVCEYCVSGWETLCVYQKNTGYSADGGYAQYLLAHGNYAVKIPKGLDLYEAAPILCAGVTSYKAIKETEAKAGQWIAIVGVGGLGHLAVQYAIAMGMRVMAVDIANDKLELAAKHGAEITVNSLKEDPAIAAVQKAGGMQGVVITAVSPTVFKKSLEMLKRGGFCSIVGLPPGEFETPIFDLVLSRKTIRGSIVGTRQDAAEALDFAARGKVKSDITIYKLEQINEIIDLLRKNKINGRAVMKME